jgi:putative hydrolase of the HAD superfamily
MTDVIKVIAFDLDDTLWHVDPVIIQAEKKLSQWLKSEVPRMQHDTVSMREFRDQVLEENPEFVHRVTDFRLRLIELAMLDSRIPAHEASVLAADAMEVFLDARNEIEFFEGALDAITQVAARYRLGALTNGNADIQRLGLSNHFSFAFSAEDVGAPKPAPNLFHAAIAHTGCKPIEMVYVGDDPVKDIDTANSVGFRTIWLRNAARPGPGESEPDQIIDDIRELPDAIEQLKR